MKRVLATAALVMGVFSCALLSRGETLSVRYFTPESPRARLTAATAPATRPVIRLGRVQGAPHLRERIAYRESAYEVGFYDDREWTDRPDAFVRRALARKLFEERGFERATGGAASTLDVEVLGFEEVRMPGVHAARVELHYQIHDGVAVRDERTITVDHPISGTRFEDFVAAISEALDEATGRIADRLAPTPPH